MKAVLFDGKLRLVSNYLKPVPEEGEALICVQTAGICQTDIEIIKGYMGFNGVLGHEFVGVVETCNKSDLHRSEIITTVFPAMRLLCEGLPSPDLLSSRVC